MGGPDLPAATPVDGAAVCMQSTCVCSRRMCAVDVCMQSTYVFSMCADGHMPFAAAACVRSTAPPYACRRRAVQASCVERSLWSPAPPYVCGRRRRKYADSDIPAVAQVAGAAVGESVKRRAAAAVRGNRRSLPGRFRRDHDESACPKDTPYGVRGGIGGARDR
jgi:hypothetical protein